MKKNSGKWPTSGCFGKYWESKFQVMECSLILSKTKTDFGMKNSCYFRKNNFFSHVVVPN